MFEAEKSPIPHYGQPYDIKHLYFNLILTHLSLDKIAAIVADDNLKCSFLNENNRITIWILVQFVPRSPIDNKTALL